jgi:hypothetical protein
MGKTSGNLKEWIVLELFSARMIDVSSTPDTGCGMQVHGWETTRWPSFIRWGSKSKREAFSAVSVIEDPTAPLLARQRCITCIPRQFYLKLPIKSLCHDLGQGC